MSQQLSLRTKILLVLGLLAAAAFIAGRILNVAELRLIAKPLPVIFMALYLLLLPDKNRFQWLVIGGLLFGAVGDIFLEYAPETFLFGLIAFLIGHLLYIAAFTSDCRRPAWGIAIFAYLFGIVMYSFLEMGDMGEMALPVLIYILVITTMVWRAFARFHAPGIPETSGKAAVVGALFFLASDSLLAITLFIYELPLASFIVIITYWLGQLGITLAAKMTQSSSMASPNEF